MTHCSFTLQSSDCSNYTIMYYLLQMLQQLKLRDVIILQKQLFLQIQYYTCTHSVSFHNIPGMSSWIAVQGWSLTKVFGSSSFTKVQKVATFMYSCVLNDKLCEEITMWWGYCQVKDVIVSAHWKNWPKSSEQYQVWPNYSCTQCKQGNSGAKKHNWYISSDAACSRFCVEGLEILLRTRSFILSTVFSVVGILVAVKWPKSLLNTLF